MTTTQVIRLTGCTGRELHYWIARGLVTPFYRAPGSGQAHEFDLATVERVRLIVRARRLGLSLSAISRLLEAQRLDLVLAVA